MLSPSEQELYFRSLRGGARVLNRERVKKLLGVRDNYAAKLLHALAKRGVATKAAKGVYVLAPADAVEKDQPPVVDPWPVLDEIMKLLAPDYFVAYASAAYLHGAAAEVPFNVQIAVPVQRRPIRIGSARVTFHVVRKEKWFGTQRLRQSGEFVTVSDLERTLVDCAARPELCGGAEGLAQIVWELAWKARPRIVATYVRKREDPGAANRLGFIASRLRRHKDPRKVAPLLDVLRNHAGQGTYALDPTRPRRGARIDPHWRLRVNADVEAWRRA